MYYCAMHVVDGHVLTRKGASRHDPLVLSTKYMKLWSLSSILRKQPSSIISRAACIINSANREHCCPVMSYYMTKLKPRNTVLGWCRRLAGLILNDQQIFDFKSDEYG